VFFLFLFVFRALVFVLKTMQASYTAVMQKASASNKSGYEALLKVYRETDLSQEKGRIIGNNSIISFSICLVPTTSSNFLFFSFFLCCLYMLFSVNL